MLKVILGVNGTTEANVFRSSINTRVNIDARCEYALNFHRFAKESLRHRFAKESWRHNFLWRVKRAHCDTKCTLPYLLFFQQNNKPTTNSRLIVASHLILKKTLIHINTLYMISKCIDVYEVSRTSVKRSFSITIKFWSVLRIRII